MLISGLVNQLIGKCSERLVGTQTGLDQKGDLTPLLV